MKKVDTCRICFTGSCYKNINNDYAYRGELENYGRMLQETFNLALKSKRSLICDQCVTKLRDATVFRQKVLDSEQYLVETNEQTVDKFDSDIELDSDIEIKNECKHSSIKMERKTMIGLKGEDFVITLGRSNLKQKYEMKFIPSDLEDDADIDDNIDLIPEEKVTKKSSRHIAEYKIKRKTNIKKSVQPERKETSQLTTQKHLKENSQKLITNSNLCIFRSLRTKFGCTYCNESFFDFKELRNHSEIHLKSDLSNICKKLRGLSYKNAEITDLKCLICNENTESLDTLKSHLLNHDIKFGGDGQHLLIPYKLEDDFQCVICQDTFYTFTRLAIHMNRHSTHNVCEKCGLSYYNRMSLRNHIQNQHNYKKCSRCDLRFLTVSDKAKHMKKIHRIGFEKRYCLRCNMTFQYTYQLMQHRIEKHGFRKLTVSCHHCGKIVKSPTNLKIHIRNVHLKERNFPCQVCEMRFFTKTDKERHERTHLDVRSFSCNICETKFKSKDSVRRHLKRQHGQKDVKEIGNMFSC